MIVFQHFFYNIINDPSPIQIKRLKASDLFKAKKVQRFQQTTV